MLNEIPAEELKRRRTNNVVVGITQEDASLVAGGYKAIGAKEVSHHTDQVARDHILVSLVFWITADDRDSRISVVGDLISGNCVSPVRKEDSHCSIADCNEFIGAGSLSDTNEIVANRDLTDAEGAGRDTANYANSIPGVSRNYISLGGNRSVSNGTNSNCVCFST